MLPFGGTFLEWIENSVDSVVKVSDDDASPVFDQKFYGYELGGSLESVNNILSDTTNIITGLIGLGQEIHNSAEAGSEVDWEDHLRNVLGFTEDFAQYFGVPVGNVDNTVKALTTHGFDIATGDNEYVSKYYTLRIYNDVTSATKKDFFENLERAYNSGDERKYNELYDLMIHEDGFATSSGTAEENINAKIKEWDKVKNREDNGISDDIFAEFKSKCGGKTSQEVVYDALNSMNLTQKQKDILWEQTTTGLSSYSRYDEEYRAGKNKGGKEALRKEQGIDSEAYSEALKKYDADGNGHYKQDEVYNAINSMNLTQQQKEFLWNEKYPKTPYSQYRPGK